MFSSKLRYYHGTSKAKWQQIKKECLFKPSHIKSVGNYWVTKGVYFVCENPYIALWYAHIAALHDNSDPVVIYFDYDIKGSKKEEIVNLLTSDGHKMLAIALTLYKKKLGSNVLNNKFSVNVNLDSFALELLMLKSKILKGIIACFQEGKSFQSMILGHSYTNKNDPKQNGFGSGDHVEICFYPDLKFEDYAFNIMDKKEVLKGLAPECKIWDLVCQGLTDSIENENFKNELSIYLKLSDVAN